MVFKINKGIFIETDLFESNQIDGKIMILRIWKRWWKTISRKPADPAFSARSTIFFSFITRWLRS